MSWYSYAYALVIWNTLGEASEKAFAKEWGIALGIDNALQLREVVKDTLEVAAVLLVADCVGLVSTLGWWEAHLDFLSAQATLLHGGATTWWERVSRHMDFSHRLVDE